MRRHEKGQRTAKQPTRVERSMAVVVVVKSKGSQMPAQPNFSGYARDRKRGAHAGAASYQRTSRALYSEGAVS